MESLVALQLGFGQLIENPMLILWLAFGVLMGVVFGVVPGLTGALGVTLMLPFTFGMSPAQGITILIGIYVGAIAGGFVAAILLNIPGSPASLVTCFDGPQIAKAGRAGEALILALYGSFIGGVFSAGVLIVVAPQLARVALAFGPWEYFAMGVMGLSIVVGVVSKDVVKGLIAAIIGILFAMVGIDPVSGAHRFTFGMWQLGGGLDILATLMGLFAIAEILTQTKKLGKTIPVAPETGKVPLFPGRQLLKGRGKVFLSSSVIGTAIGIVPGVAQSTAALMSYLGAKQISKEPEKFGKGSDEGVIASETANNACCGGALVPMMTMGIPGDVVTAIMIGGLVIHGLQPGPLLFINNMDVVGSMYVAYLVAAFMMYLMMIVIMKGFIKLLLVPLQYLFPVLLLMCVVGTIAVNNRIFDSWVLLIIGIVGYVLLQNNFPLPPIVLGYILGPIIENNFRIAIIASRGSLIPLFGRPVAMAMLVIGLFMVCFPLIKNAMNKRKAANVLQSSNDEKNSEKGEAK